MPPDIDPDIICFKHCKSNIFTFSVPNNCPKCNQPLTEAENLCPFALPPIFVNATQTPCAVILRPSTGDFWSDFHNTTNLHIALTDADGSIVEFDQPGLTRTVARRVDRSRWGQCLLILQVPESWQYEWEQQLQHVVEDRGWRHRKYDEDRLNCFSFVLEFLRFLRYGDYWKYADSRERFSTEFIVPKTRTVAKYITIFRRIREHGYWAELDQ
uniref:MKRN2 opposite strand protein n=1 Tax=Culex pipiens TaxID=7175 RepID=A0A8D8B9C6_CULPI